jgi:hypothetical protein
MRALPLVSRWMRSLACAGVIFLALPANAQTSGRAGGMLPRGGRGVPSGIAGGSGSTLAAGANFSPGFAGRRSLQFFGGCGYPGYSNFYLGSFGCYGGYYPPVGIYAGLGPLGFYGYGGYPGYPPVERVYIERQLIITPPPDGDYRRERGRGEDREPDADRGDRGDGDAARGQGTERTGGYYLAAPGRSESLAGAVADIRRAWLNGDYGRLRDRFPAASQIRIYPNGRYAYAVSGAEFGKMTRDAMAGMETTAFDLEAPSPPEGDRAFVSGRHVFTAVDAETGAPRSRTVYVSYTLRLQDGLWRIAAAGSSGQPLRRHED